MHALVEILAGVEGARSPRINAPTLSSSPKASLLDELQDGDGRHGHGRLASRNRLRGSTGQSDRQSRTGEADRRAPPRASQHPRYPLRIRARHDRVVRTEPRRGSGRLGPRLDADQGARHRPGHEAPHHRLNTVFQEASTLGDRGLARLGVAEGVFIVGLAEPGLVRRRRGQRSAGVEPSNRQRVHVVPASPGANTDIGSIERDRAQPVEPVRRVRISDHPDRNTSIPWAMPPGAHGEPARSSRPHHRAA